MGSFIGDSDVLPDGKNLDEIEHGFILMVNIDQLQSSADYPNHFGSRWLNASADTCVTFKLSHWILIQNDDRRFI